jgi:hypothetical protein
MVGHAKRPARRWKATIRTDVSPVRVDEIDAVPVGQTDIPYQTRSIPPCRHDAADPAAGLED